MDALFGLDHAALNEEGLSLLTTVYDDVLVEIYQDLLTDAGIPLLKKDRGGGTAMRIITGANRYGTDLYVPTERLEEARQLLESTPIETVEDESADEGGEESDEP